MASPRWMPSFKQSSISDLKTAWPKKTWPRPTHPYGKSLFLALYSGYLWVASTKKIPDLVGGSSPHIWKICAFVKLDHETPNFPGENKNSLKPPSSKLPKLRLLHCFLIHPQKTQKSDAFWWCFLVYGKFCVLVWGVRKNGGRIFLVLLQMTNGSFFQLSSMAKGYKSIHWKSWGVLDVVECQRWQLAGAGNFQESKNKESSLLVKVHICPTKFLLTNKNQPAIKNACDTGDFIISYDTTMIVFFSDLWFYHW